jgi:hypothetical protein
MRFWHEEFTEQQIQFILDKIKAMRVPVEEGRIGLRGIGEMDIWTAVLVSAIGLQIRTDALRTTIVRRALFSPDLPLAFTEKDFRKVVHGLHNQYENEQHIYRVVFPIWNQPIFLNGLRVSGDVTLNFSPTQSSKIFKKIEKERKIQRTDQFCVDFFTKERERDLQKCTLCLAEVRASSPADANERASRLLYETLGLINLAKDNQKHWRSSSRVGGKLPVSEVLIGPHTTTHFENGKLSHEGFWHEEWVGGPQSKTQSPEAMKAWEKRFQQLVEGVNRSHWQEDCKSALARYFKAFSNPNLEESFLEGWRLFENISGSRYEKIDNQIIRASNIFESNNEYGIIGQHLKLRRNLMAHGHAIKADDEETLAFQMLQFVIPFLQLYILNGFKFESTKELWDFLDLPAQKQDRTSMRIQHEKKLDLLAKAAKFRGETDG